MGYPFGLLVSDVPDLYRLTIVLMTFLGGCRSSSPAGKRRVDGVDLVAASSNLDGVINGFPNGKSSQDGSSEVNGYTLTAATTIIAAISVASIVLFAAIFFVLQVHLRSRAKVAKRTSTM